MARTAGWLVALVVVLRAMPGLAAADFGPTFNELKRKALLPVATDLDCDVVSAAGATHATLETRAGFQRVFEQPRVVVMTHGFDAFASLGRHSAADMRYEFAPIIAALDTGRGVSFCFVSWGSLSGFLEAQTAMRGFVTAAQETRRLAPLGRQVVFIGFSTGGQLVKQAAVTVSVADGLSDFGFITLATPHRGTALAPAGDVLAQAVKGWSRSLRDDPTLGNTARSLGREADRLHGAVGVADLRPEADNPRLAALNRKFVAAAGRLHVLNVCSSDDFVAPPDSCALQLLRGETVLRGPTHWGFTHQADPQVLEAVRRFVDDLPGGH